MNAEIKYHDDDDDEFFGCSSNMISTCCGASPWGEIDTHDKTYDPIGICSDCHDHATFEQDIEEE
jgi:hypothetical protein